MEAAACVGGDGRGRDAPRPVHGEAIAVAVETSFASDNKAP